MGTIKDWKGNPCTLSEDVYEVIEGEDMTYPAGTLVRLISGIDDNPVPGHHFCPEYVTVCRIDAKVAQFAGLLRSKVRKIEEG